MKQTFGELHIAHADVKYASASTMPSADMHVSVVFQNPEQIERLIAGLRILQNNFELPDTHFHLMDSNLGSSDNPSNAEITFQTATVYHDEHRGDLRRIMTAYAASRLVGNSQ